MEYMFWQSYEIKQNLCAWRLKDFPFTRCNGIFGHSGCQYKEKPVDTSSSFCEAQCQRNLPDYTPPPGSTICGLGGSFIDDYLNPPKEVMDLVKIGLGIGEHLMTMSSPIIKQTLSERTKLSRRMGHQFYPLILR